MAFLIIEPNDSLFFRGGKPFAGGVDSWTDSSFLPNPSVIWGALFSILFVEKKVKIIDNKVSKDERKRLKIKNIYLYNRNRETVLVPAPLDIFVDEDKRKIASDYKDDDFISNCPLKLIQFVENKSVKIIKNNFIKINSLFQHYVNKHFENLILYNFDDIFLQDYKIGIKRNKITKTAQDSYLYRIDMTQFKEEWAFLIEYKLNGINFDNKGILKLGGEAKTAFYEKISKPIALNNAEKFRENIIKEVIKKQFVKVFFKSPVYFKNGWEPEKDNLLCANVGKPIHIGGFDMEKNKPKQMKRYVPAGSIYVFEKKADHNFNMDFNDDSESYKGFGKYEILTI